MQWHKNRDSQPVSRFISEMIQDKAIVTVERQQEIVCDLLNGAISSDLEWPLTKISKADHSLFGAEYLRNGTR